MCEIRAPIRRCTNTISPEFANENIVSVHHLKGDVFILNRKDLIKTEKSINGGTVYQHHTK